MVLQFRGGNIYYLLFFPLFVSSYFQRTLRPLTGGSPSALRGQVSGGGGGHFGLTMPFPRASLHWARGRDTNVGGTVGLESTACAVSAL